MTTTKPKKANVAHPEAGWSLDLPGDRSADGIADEEALGDADEPRSRPERDERKQVQPDAGEENRNQLKDR